MIRRCEGSPNQPAAPATLRVPVSGTSRWASQETSLMTKPSSPEKQPRAILPDGASDTLIVLVKACTTLRLTYEIRLTAFMAAQRGLKFILAVLPETHLTPELSSFVMEQSIEVERGQ